MNKMILIYPFAQLGISLSPLNLVLPSDGLGFKAFAIIMDNSALVILLSRLKVPS
ncbi:MAG TPA: hypothetical protein VIO64_10525 [Pseudobacteroides sp.]